MILAVLAAALIDYAAEVSALPEYGPATMGGDREVIEGRRLRSEYNDRAWIYSVALVTIVGALVVVALRSAEQTDDLQQIAAVCEALRTDEARLREAVELARARGRSWNLIALALGVSRQAARQRFADQAPV